MNLSEPMTSVIPGVHGQVLQVLAKTNKPLTARQVALLTDGRIGKRRANDVLQEFAEAGVALRQDSAPSYVYTLNRDHLAAEAILSLAAMRERLLERVQKNLSEWRWKPIAAYLFGSTASGTASERSDIDLLILRPPQCSEDEWDEQLSALAENVHRWSGNQCEILDLTEAELANAVAKDDRLARDLRDHGRVLYGAMRATQLLRPRRVGANR